MGAYDQQTQEIYDKLVKAIGKNLRTYRKRKKISLRDFAKKIGASHSTLSYAERGEMPASLALIASYSYYLGVPLKALLEVESDKDGLFPGLAQVINDRLNEDGQKILAAVIPTLEGCHRINN